MRLVFSFSPVRRGVRFTGHESGGAAAAAPGKGVRDSRVRIKQMEAGTPKGVSFLLGVTFQLYNPLSKADGWHSAMCLFQGLCCFSCSWAVGSMHVLFLIE